MENRRQGPPEYTGKKNVTMSKYSLKPEQTTTAVRNKTCMCRGGLGRDHGQGRVHGAVFCGCSTLRAGRMQRALGMWKRAKPRRVMCTFTNTAWGLCPSQCCSPMKCLGFWIPLIPYCPPQQVHFPTSLMAAPPFLFSKDAEKGKSDPRLEEGLCLPCGQGWRGWDPGLTSHIILHPHGDNTFLTV